jgi:hypothetical protein
MSRFERCLESRVVATIDGRLECLDSLTESLQFFLAMENQEEKVSELTSQIRTVLKAIKTDWRGSFYANNNVGLDSDGVSFAILPVEEKITIPSVKE